MVTSGDANSIATGLLIPTTVSVAMGGMLGSLLGSIFSVAQGNSCPGIFSGRGWSLQFQSKPFGGQICDSTIDPSSISSSYHSASILILWLHIKNPYVHIH
jgi:flagellar basal body P-ring protein FlgI